LPENVLSKFDESTTKIYWTAFGITFSFGYKKQYICAIEN
jgi:hypothetical protein